MYLTQVFPGVRSPQNYLHAILALSVVALATWQTQYGYRTEWAFVTENLPSVSSGSRHFWLAIAISILALYSLSLLLLPHLFKHEAASWRAAKQKNTNLHESP